MKVGKTSGAMGTACPDDAKRRLREPISRKGSHALVIGQSHGQDSQRRANRISCRRQKFRSVAWRRLPGGFQRFQEATPQLRDRSTRLWRSAFAKWRRARRTRDKIAHKDEALVRKTIERFLGRVEAAAADDGGDPKNESC